MQNEFDSSAKTIERDVKNIKSFLHNQNYYEDEIKIENGKYYLDSNDNQIGLANKHLLAIAKVLIGSRAFKKAKLKQMLQALNRMYDSNQTRGSSSLLDLVKNELFNYKAAQSEFKVDKIKKREIYFNSNSESEGLADKIWNLNKAARENRMVKLKYQKENASEKKIREVKPLGVIFSEYYFYLITYWEEEKKEIPYRLDRIEDYELGDRGDFKIEYTDKLKEGEFNNQLPYMIPGSPYKLKFKYDGPSLSAVVNKLPSTEKIEDKDDYYLITARVRSRYGAKMMLLSQQDNIEVVEPEELRTEMKETIKQMYQRYQD